MVSVLTLETERRRPNPRPPSPFPRLNYSAGVERGEADAVGEAEERLHRGDVRVDGGRLSSPDTAECVTAVRCSQLFAAAHDSPAGSQSAVVIEVLGLFDTLRCDKNWPAAQHASITHADEQGIAAYDGDHWPV
jgi:hypothetical protein